MAMAETMLMLGRSYGLCGLYGLSRLFKSFEFGNGSKIYYEKLVILEFKYLQNKKW